LSISRSTADNFKNVQSFSCNLISFESKVISKALSVNMLVLECHPIVNVLVLECRPIVNVLVLECRPTVNVNTNTFII
jgi:hypothetical protein